jgi:hypothetical protein
MTLSPTTPTFTSAFSGPVHASGEGKQEASVKVIAPNITANFLVRLFFSAVDIISFDRIVFLQIVPMIKPQCSVHVQTVIAIAYLLKLQPE